MQEALGFSRGVLTWNPNSQKYEWNGSVMNGFIDMDAVASGIRTLIVTGGMLGIVISLAPLAFGRIKLTWLIGGLMSTALFCIVDLMLGTIANSKGLKSPSADWYIVKTIIAISLGIIFLFAILSFTAKTFATRSTRRTQKHDEKTFEQDPRVLARKTVPAMTAEVTAAMERIALFRTLAQRIGRSDDADALIMIEKRLPSIMDLYAVASSAATAEEKTALATTALSSVIQLGQMAEDARSRIATDLRRDLDVEAGYI